MNANDRSSRTIARLSSRIVLGPLVAAALASVACGGDDDRAAFEQEIATADGGTESADTDASNPSSFDASTSSGDATSTSSAKDASSGLTTDAAPISIEVAGDSGVCSTVGGIFSLNKPATGSSLLCPTESVICSVTVAATDCKVTTICHAQDGGVGGLLSLLSIPVEVLGPNNGIHYSTTLPIDVLGVDAGGLSFDCSANFGDDTLSLGLSCTATVPVLGTVDVCAYAALPIDGGL
jgi:hypothetical protein